MAELERVRRQREAEQKMVEEVAAKRLEELVARRVEEELERRRDEIEAEVLRRVEEAKRLMEQQMLEELQEKRRQQEEDQKKREVELCELCFSGIFCWICQALGTGALLCILIGREGRGFQAKENKFGLAERKREVARGSKVGKRCPGLYQRASLVTPKGHTRNGLHMVRENLRFIIILFIFNKTRC